MPSRAIFVPLLILIALTHAFLAGFASSTKSPTYDEPLHLLGAALHWQAGDFRVNPEHPALWHNLIVMGQLSKPIALDVDTPAFALIPFDQNQQWLWLAEQVNGPDRIGSGAFLSYLQSTRWRSAFLFGGSLVLLTGFFIRDLLRTRRHRDTLALLGAAFIGFDANFLAHAPLVTNDVAIAAAVTAMLWAGLRVARELTWLNLAFLALVTGVAVCTKFTGVVIGGGLWLAIIGRAFFPGSSWRAFGREAVALPQRLTAIIVLTLAMGAASFAIVWASYGFRFNAIRADLATAQPLPRDPADLRQFNFDAIRGMNRVFEFERRTGRQAMPDRRADDAAALSGSAFDGAATALVYAARDVKLLPESYLYGFYYAYVRSKFRGGFVAGEYYADGRWYYYPLAILFKTPTATLALFGFAGMACATSLARRGLRGADWTAIAVIGLPVTVYFASAMTSALNIGVRHVLVVYPALVAMALAGLSSPRTRGEESAADETRMDTDEKPAEEGTAHDSSASHPRSPAATALVAIACGLTAVESILATPDFIPFFNLPSRTFGEGGAALLSDSNLDWGQDLPALAAWQREHPDTLLYLNYFGTIDPAHYGLRFIPFGEGFDTRPEEARKARFDQPGTVAISATNWQGVYATGFRPMFVTRTPKPVGKVGGSIYLFDFQPKPAPTTTPATKASGG